MFGVNEIKVIPSTCSLCYGACPILVYVKNGVVVKIEGNPNHPQTQGRICGKGLSGLMVLYDPNRVTTPLKRTNPKKGIGIDPKWVPISWDEALDIITEKLRKVIKEDPARIHLAAWPFVSPGEGHANNWGRAIGATVFAGSWGAFCGGPCHIISTICHMGFKDLADFKYSEYIVITGSGQGNLANGSSIINTIMFADTRAEGKKKIVIIDPRKTEIAEHAYRWLPALPGTELALFLSWCYCVIYEIGKFDAEYLKVYTNAPYLIDANGHYVRDPSSNKPLIWDPVDGMAKPYDSPSIKDYALEGEYEVNGIKCKPAFQIFKERIKEYTPEWAEKITTISAQTIREVARELVEHARIGETIEIDGKVLPYRPVGFGAYSGLFGHSNAHMANMAYLILCQLLGCLDAVGGTIAMNFTSHDFGTKPYGFTPGKDGLHLPPVWQVSPLPVEYPFRYFYKELMISWWPGLTAWYVLLDPEGYGLKYRPEDCVLILYSHNPMATGWNSRQLEELFKRWGFVVDITTHLDETAQFADIILPDVTYLERLSATNWRDDLNPEARWGVHITQPCVEPLGQCRDGFWVLFELAKRLGFLKDWFAFVNTFWLTECPIELDQEHSVEEYWDHVVRNSTRMQGKEANLEDLKKLGFIEEPVPIEVKYRPYLYNGLRVPFYFSFFIEHRDYLLEQLKPYWDKLPSKAKDLVQRIIEAHKPLPEWEPCASCAFQEKNFEYDMHAITYKSHLTTFSRTARNPMLMEVKERHPAILKIQIHEDTAKKRGISEGDIIIVESICGKIEGEAHLTRGIHPNVVAITGPYGLWANQLEKSKKHPHFNTLIPFDIDMCEPLTGGFEHHVVVKVYKKREYT